MNIVFDPLISPVIPNFVKDNALVPLVPVVPDVPLVPDVPVVPDVPLVPLLPLVPDVPDVPELPDVPLTPITVPPYMVKISFGFGGYAVVKVVPLM